MLFKHSASHHIVIEKTMCCVVFVFVSLSLKACHVKMSRIRHTLYHESSALSFSAQQVSAF